MTASADFLGNLPLLVRPRIPRVEAGETLHALFERNGHICLFCMKHYTEALLNFRGGSKGNLKRLRQHGGNGLVIAVGPK